MVQEEKRMLEDISNSELNHIIDEYIHSERDRKIIKRRLVDGLTYERLAEEFDMSTRQVKRIVYASEKIIFKHI